jgi:outer membrane protein assembly factor BamB
MNRLLLTLVLAVSVSGCSLFGRGDDGPQPAELVDFQPTLKFQLQWSVKVGGGADIPGVQLLPSYYSGRIYAASTDGVIRAVDAESGRQVWDLDTDLTISAGPSAADDLIVIGTIDGEVAAYSADTGAALWKARVSSEILASPVIHSGVVVVRSQDGRVFGFDAANGERRWIFDRSVPLLSLRGNSPPAARGGYIFIGFDNGRIVSLRADDGTLAWEQALALPEGRTELDRIVDIDGQIMVVSSDVYAVSFQGRLASLTADSGRLLWVRDFSSHSGIAVSRSQLNVSDADDSVWGLDRLSGGTLWRQDQLVRRGITAPVRLGDSVVVGDFEGYLHVLSGDDGSFQARTRVDGDGLLASPLVVGQTLYVLGRSGKLLAYRLG